MPRIAIINPTTTEAFGHRNAAAGRAVAARDTEIIPVTLRDGPPSIEGHYDEAIATVALMAELRRLEAEPLDGYVIACFGDPGIWAAREMTRRPVIGIAEAAFHIASLVATKFSVVTSLQRTAIICEHLLVTLGMERRCARIRAAEIPVLDLEESGEAELESLRAECARALAEDGSGALVLGCAGMADQALRLQAHFDVPVIDGVAAAVKMIEGAVSLGIWTSKRGDLAHPLPKTYLGAFAGLSPAPRPDHRQENKA